MHIRHKANKSLHVQQQRLWRVASSQSCADWAQECGRSLRQQRRPQVPSGIGGTSCHTNFLSLPAMSKQLFGVMPNKNTAFTKIHHLFTALHVLQQRSVFTKDPQQPFHPLGET